MAKYNGSFWSLLSAGSVLILVGLGLLFLDLVIRFWWFFVLSGAVLVLAGIVGQMLSKRS